MLGKNLEKMVSQFPLEVIKLVGLDDIILQFSNDALGIPINAMES